MTKFQYKYKLMSKNSWDKKFTEYMQFTFDPEGTKKEIQEIWPKKEFKVMLNKNRNI